MDVVVPEAIYAVCDYGCVAGVGSGGDSVTGKIDWSVSGVLSHGNGGESDGSGVVKG